MRKTIPVLAIAILVLAAVPVNAQISTINAINGAHGSAFAADIPGNLWFADLTAHILGVATFPSSGIVTTPLSTGATTDVILRADPLGRMAVITDAREFVMYELGKEIRKQYEVLTPSSGPPLQGLFPGPGNTMRTVGCDTTGCTVYEYGPAGKLTTSFKSTTTPGVSFFINDCVSDANGNADCSGIQASSGGTTSGITRYGPAGDSTFFPHTAGIVDKITIGPDGRIYYIYYGSLGNGLGLFDLSGNFTDHPLAGSGKPTGLTAGRDGRIDAIDQNGAFFQYNPFDQTISSATLSSVGSPQGLAAARSEDGNATAPCQSGQLVTSSGGTLYLITEFSPPSCTDITASAHQDRATGTFNFSCSVSNRTTPSNKPDAAVNPTLTLYGLSAATLQLINQHYQKEGWATCGINGTTFQCKSDTLQPGTVNNLAIDDSAGPLEPDICTCGTDAPVESSLMFFDKSFTPDYKVFTANVPTRRVR
jgi:streptogramin lyase